MGNPAEASKTAVALVAALQDKNPLVGRGVLDLLIQFFPTSTQYLIPLLFGAHFCRLFSHQDRVLLVKDAMLILCRRDMSLTRRYYMWVSPDETVTELTIQLQSEAFLSLLDCMKLASIEKAIKPFKLIVFIMDRSSFANPILKNTFFQIVTRLYETWQRFSGSKACQEKVQKIHYSFTSFTLMLSYWARLINFLI